MQHRYLLILLILVGGIASGCDSAPSAKRNIEVLYRFENLRKNPTGDEWDAIKPILDRASTRTVEVKRSGVRSLGTLEVANYDAKCVLLSLADFEKVQADLEAIGSRDIRGERIETYLSGISATYKSNFIVATVNIAVSGASVTGHRIRVFGTPGEAPVETTAGAGGIWVVHLAVVPQTQWVYGVSEDPSNKIPSRYFRINVATRKQERVEETDFRKLFGASPANPGQGAKAVSETAADQPASRPAGASSEDNALAEQRKKEEEDIRKRRDEEEKRRREELAPKPKP